MTLAAGIRLDSFEIVAPLGAGGMGEVYRARDTTLKRDVAIKVLPEYWSHDPERLHRFELEAQAAAALNHPNIVSIFHVGQYDGSPYIVTELLQGETLRDRLRKGPMRLREVLDRGVELARGLAAAHDAGIVHRDLKPENIWVTKDGRIKILDFGLAKLDPAKAASADDATVTLQPQTNTGHVLGTVGYMSPEQVRGQVADARSDIFAVGVILYEMLTGKPAFRKATSAETMTAILNEDPPAVSQTAPSFPPGLQRIMNRCLAKSPEQRFQHASDLAFALESLLDSSGSAVTAVNQTVLGKRWIWLAAAVVAVAIAAAFGAYRFFRKDTRAIDTRNINIRTLTDNGQAVAVVAVSPDGSLVAYGRREEERSLRVKQVATGSEVTVVPPQPGFFSRHDDDAGTTFSPGSNHLYYTHSDPANGINTNLYSVASLGGPSRQIVSDVASGVAFSPDGKRMAFRRSIQDKGEDQIVIANTDGSNEQVVFRHESGLKGLTTNLSWSPASDLIAVGASESEPNIREYILVLTPDGKLAKKLPLAISVDYLAWLPDASGLFVIGVANETGLRRQIWFVPYPGGKPVKVSNDLSNYYGLSVAADGKSLVTIQQRVQATIYAGDSPAILNDKVDWQLAPISTEQATGYSLSWTTAGKLLQMDGVPHVYLAAADGGGRVRLLEGDEMDGPATACGTGEVVVTTRQVDGVTPHLWRLNLANGELKQLTFGKIERAPSCTPDGKWVVYEGGKATDKLSHIFKVSVAGGVPDELAHGDVHSPTISPDGESVAYIKIDGQGANAKPKLDVQKLDGGAPVYEIEVPEFDSSLLEWTPDGHALAYVKNTTGTLQNVYMQPLPSGPLVQLTHFNSEPGEVVGFAWSRDGKKFAITRARYHDCDVVMFTGFR